MRLFRRPAVIPAPEDCLPGRTDEMVVAERHFVLDAPLRGPFPDGLDSLIVGMGCFWGSERLYWQLPGVFTTAVGYSGGTTPNPTYDETCTGRTGHTEAVLVVFDPQVVSLDDLFAVFWENHDPTQHLGQGNDHGSQYRTAIYTNSDEQQAAALMQRRITGIENEYGVTCTLRGQRRLSPDEVARYLFRGWCRGGAAPTSSSPTARACTSTSARTPSTPRPSATRCTTWSRTTRRASGSSSSCWSSAEQRLRRGGHPRRHLPVQEQHRLGRQLLRLPRELPDRRATTSSGALHRGAHPVPGQPPDLCRCGQGAADRRGATFSVSQRAEHIWEGVSSATTRSRPIINTRDEPHADAERYRRLHVIVGDSNMSEYATFLKVGATSLLLRMLEDPDRGAAGHDLENPIRAIREISHDIDLPAPGAPGQRARGLGAGHPGEYLNRALRYAANHDLSRRRSRRSACGSTS
jgi:peptide-methionine (S)-S-oxide reductase